MSKTRRNKNQVPEKEGKKLGAKPLEDSEIESWEEDEDLDEDEDEEDEDWEPEWPDEDDDELRAGGWGDDLLMDR